MLFGGISLFSYLTNPPLIVPIFPEDQLTPHGKSPSIIIINVKKSGCVAWGRGYLEGLRCRHDRCA